jgi:hypothetical protein
VNNPPNQMLVPSAREDAPRPPIDSHPAEVDLVAEGGIEGGGCAEGVERGRAKGDLEGNAGPRRLMTTTVSHLNLSGGCANGRTATAPEPRRSEAGCWRRHLAPHLRFRSRGPGTERSPMAVIDGPLAVAGLALLGPDPGRCAHRGDDRRPVTFFGVRPSDGEGGPVADRPLQLLPRRDLIATR